MSGSQLVRKPVEWLADTLQILRKFPQPVVRDIGRALAVAQGGEKHPAAKPLKGFSALAFSKLSRTMMARPTGLSIQSDF